jgi:porin
MSASHEGAHLGSCSNEKPQLSPGIEERITKRVLQIIGALVVLVMASSAGQAADERPTIGSDASGHESQAEGILPLRDYSGDLWSRSVLTGDWGGVRSSLAGKGISGDLSFATLLQGVADGGADQETRAGTSMDLWAHIDFMRMGLIPGGLLTVRAEGDFGDSVLSEAGTITAINYGALMPIGTLNEDTVALTNLYYTQFIGKQFGVFAGRFDTFHDGMVMEFAGAGPRAGARGFVNTNLVSPQMVAVTTPYVTALGGGLLAKLNDNFAVSAMVLDRRESSRAEGLGNLGDDGWNALMGALAQYRLAGLPGGAQLGVSVVWDGDFTKLGDGQLLVVGEGLESSDESWNVFGNFWQYVQVFEDAGAAPLHLDDGRPDLRGWGVFAIWGVADEDTNPFTWSVAGGIGGRGLIPGREEDVFGIGYFYSKLQTGGIVAGAIDSRYGEQGFEVFYEAALTPWMHLTPDLQVVEPGPDGTDTAVILGLRLLVDF